MSELQGWRIGEQGHCHLETATHHALIITHEKSVYLCVWERSKAIRLVHVFCSLGNSAMDDGVYHWGCTDPVAAARAQAEKETGYIST